MASSPIVNRYDLHRSALNGDDQAVSQSLETGADINSLDDEGRTPIMCAVAGDRYVFCSVPPFMEGIPCVDHSLLGGRKLTRQTRHL
jgi:hypothetical protein